MKLGLAFSGGGMRGLAHAGVLKAFEAMKVPIDVYTGTSSGSHIAVLSAMGFKADEIYELFKKYAFRFVGNDTEVIVFDSLLFNKRVKFDGLRSGKTIEDLYAKVAGEQGYNKMKDLKVPVGVVATDMVTEKQIVCASVVPPNTEYINEIEIGKAVRASSSFSVIFDPCYYEDKILLDGGIFNNVPTDVARKLGADKVISIKFRSNRITESSNLMDIGMKTIDMMSSKISEQNLQNSDLVLEVFTNGTSLLDIDNMDYCFYSGYETALENREKIMALLENENG